jgi:transcriptional regulator of acetoin/glycerol metabolism
VLFRSISPEVMKVLEDFDWPGNIRQLRNCLRTMLALCENNTITIDDLDEELRAYGHLERTHGNAAGVESLYADNPLACAERKAILSELNDLRWNVTKVASKLNLSRNTLYRKMRRYGIKPPR